MSKREPKHMGEVMSDIAERYNKLTKTKMIDKWKAILGIKEWTITTEAIDKKQVVYDPEIPEEDRYYIGVHVDQDTSIATIYHDRDLTEEDIIHELLHVKYPDWTEERVNFQTMLYLAETSSL